MSTLFSFDNDSAAAMQHAKPLRHGEMQSLSYNTAFMMRRLYQFLMKHRERRIKGSSFI